MLSPEFDMLRPRHISSKSCLAFFSGSLIDCFYWLKRLPSTFLLLRSLFGLLKPLCWGGFTDFDFCY